MARFLRVNASDVPLVVEAGLALTLARLGLSLLSLSTLTGLSHRLAQAAGPHHHESATGPVTPPAAASSVSAATRPSWAVDAVANAFGLRCLPRALALQWILARRGVVSTLLIGLPVQGPPLPAHAWVEVSGQVVIGGPVDGRFSPLARLPARPVAAGLEPRPS